MRINKWKSLKKIKIKIKIKIRTSSELSRGFHGFLFTVAKIAVGVLTIKPTFWQKDRGKREW